MSETERHLGPWPGDRRAAVSITFDVDAESALDPSRPSGRLSALSAGAYSVQRGLVRILETLDRAGVPATFYVPGVTIERYPASMRDIVAAGHQLGVHGYRHIAPTKLSPTEQRSEVENGIRAIEPFVDRGLAYRAPSWDLAEATLEALHEHGFESDSSLMGDDTPYTLSGVSPGMVELPVYFDLDDFPYMPWTHDYVFGSLNGTDAMLQGWTEELDSALSEHRHITLTLHPEFSGRGSRIGALERFLASVLDRGDVWVASHSMVTNVIGRRANAGRGQDIARATGGD